MRRPILNLRLVAVLALAAPAAVFAAQPAEVAKAAKPQKVLMVLSQDQIDAKRLIAPPPAEGGEQHKAELSELHRIIAAATPERMAQAKWDDEHEDPSAFYAVIGKGFDLKTLPATAALFKLVMNDQSYAASAAKKTFPRNRPWASDATIKTCDPDDKPLTSYPSGHATMGFSVATVLATLMPEKAEAIMARARDYAFSREVCGSHYASDTEASHALGAVIATELLASPALQDKIAAAKAELKQAGFTSL
jgi:acid phosphatase (class A)